MPHHTPLIAAIATGFVLAFIFGALANRLRLSPLVGYLLAGVMVGPFTPGFVADKDLSHELSEIGVILLMFGVGLHFSLKDLLAVKNIAIPGALVQIIAATVLGMGLTWWLGWHWGAGLIFGLALSVASTVVLLRALEERQLIDNRRGKIAVGWLIVEDLVMVLALVLIPALAGLLSAEPNAGSGEQDILWPLLLTLGKVAAFIALMITLGGRLIPWLLERSAGSGSRELFTLAVLAIAMGVSYGSAVLFGVSFALGAFFAGMILNSSQYNHQAADDSRPLRDAFAVLFFVAVGMLFNPSILLDEPLLVLATVLIIVLGKGLAALLIVLAFRKPLSTGLTIAVSLAQIGEFSFILASLGVSLELMPEVGRDLILAGAIIAILLNPMLFSLLDRLQPWLVAREQRQPEASPAPASAPSDNILPLSESAHTILIGHGRVGSRISQRLQAEQMPLVIIETLHSLVEDLRQNGLSVVHGNAASSKTLAQANIASARCLIVAIANSLEAGQIISHARAANPSLQILARAQADSEVDYLKSCSADLVVMGEREIARIMLDRLGLPTH
ncbi:MAG TPA: YbaL family putative K(+) efflux transporter [Pseudomonas sp.]|uniref:YbaL family putative K(+) efflux transporter n=1 Tax=Pseudomonas sp. TaxID=306 RepID=UPI002BFB5E2A|nr:YbaL family putative K(+) efflux transporter [Pseudomonas sp.]HRL94164.1 YbaL family putative K(+) efflux transporter [Pseudomonas sp.]